MLEKYFASGKGNLVFFQQIESLICVFRPVRDVVLPLQINILPIFYA